MYNLIENGNCMSKTFGKSSLLYLNAQSLNFFDKKLSSSHSAKKDLLDNLIERISPDIIAICETFLDLKEKTNKADDYFKRKGYNGITHNIRNPRERGCLFICAKESFKVSLVYNDSFTEITVVSIANLKLDLMLVYRHQNNREEDNEIFLKKLDRFISSDGGEKHFNKIVIGDMNIDLLANDKDKSLKEDYLKIIKETNFFTDKRKPFRLVNVSRDANNFYTREKGGKKSIIDHIITDITDGVIFTRGPKFSDHFCLLFEWKCNNEVESSSSSSTTYISVKDEKFTPNFFTDRFL